jgi:hypothetical protein
MGILVHFWEKLLTKWKLLGYFVFFLYLCSLKTKIEL